MHVNEVFYSVQGEGPFMGSPAIFVRFQGCVKPFCAWCDTAYSQGKGKKVTSMTVENLLKKIDNIKVATTCDFVVLTGGEPMIVHELYSVVTQLTRRGHQVQIETSGKEFKEILYSLVWIVCSPKLYAGKFVVKDSALRYSDYFKFVVGTQKEMDLVNRFIEKKGLRRSSIYLMPEGATREQQTALMPQVMEWCKEYNLKFSPRLHTLTWGKKRGV